MAKGGIIHFRVQQDNNTKASDANVKIFAPAWVEKALEKFSDELKGAQFEISPPSGKYLVIKDKISLTDLVAIARNEAVNTNGQINLDQYVGIHPTTVLALRDLVKHCVIVGKDIATSYGGYPEMSSIHPLNKEVYVCDLPALQFQKMYNSGRHVLISEKNEWIEGPLDKDIYQHTVGGTKPLYAQAQQNTEGRFLVGAFNEKPVLFDTQAYQSFIIQDFLLAATALNTQAKLASPPDELNFKFLKYGTGFFANELKGEAKAKLLENLVIGVFKGLEQLFAQPLESRSQIKRIELPFYRDKFNLRINNLLKNIEDLCKINNVQFAAPEEDALAPTSSAYKTATTNCSDPHAPTGNEMHYGSVDAAIAENLQRKANNFNPICNPAMGSQYLTINHLSPQNISTSSAIALALASQETLLAKTRFVVFILLSDLLNNGKGFIKGPARHPGTFGILGGLIVFAAGMSAMAVITVGALIMSGLTIRNLIYDEPYISPENQTPQEKELEIQAWNDGVAAGKSWLHYFKSTVSVNDWKHINAFGIAMRYTVDNEERKARLNKL